MMTTKNQSDAFEELFRKTFSNQTCMPGDKEMCLKFWLAGQQSILSEKLPEWLRYHACLTGDCGCEIQQDCDRKVFEDIDAAIKAEGDKG